MSQQFFDGFQVHCAKELYFLIRRIVPLLIKNSTFNKVSFGLGFLTSLFDKYIYYSL